MQKIINRSRNHTLKGDHSKSLFKFLIKGINGVDLYQYSFDFPEERAIFFSGLSVQNREIWQAFMKKLPAEAYIFYANTYPEFLTSSKIVLHFTNEAETIEVISKISQNKAIVGLISDIKECLKIEIVKFQPHEINSKVRPDITPKFHENVEKFNGMVNVKNYYLRKFALTAKEIIIYDNLAYHSDNEVCRMGKLELEMFRTGQVAQVPFIEPKAPISRTTNGVITPALALEKGLIPNYTSREVYEKGLEMKRELRNNQAQNDNL